MLGKGAGKKSRAINHLACPGGAVQKPRGKQGLLPQSTQSLERNSINRVIFANDGF